MVQTIDGESFFSFTRITWFGDLDASFHIRINDTRMYYITEIDEPVQGSSDKIKATKKGKLHVKLKQIDGRKIKHTLWPVKYCEKARADLFSLTCKFSQVRKMSSDSMTNMVLDISDGWIVLDQRIKTRDRWIPGVDFIHQDSCKESHALNEDISMIKFQKRSCMWNLSIHQKQSWELLKILWILSWLVH